MNETFVDLLSRQIRAAEALEMRLRSLQLVLAAGEQRFVVTALEEVEAASEQLAGLELTRSLALSAHGFGSDVTAEELIAQLAAPDDDVRGELERLVARLRETMDRVDDAQRLAAASARDGAATTRHRRGAVMALAAE